MIMSVITKLEINYVGSLNVKRQSMNQYKEETDAKLYQINTSSSMILLCLYIFLLFILTKKQYVINR